MKYFAASLLALAGVSFIPAASTAPQESISSEPLIIRGDSFEDGIYFVQITKKGGKLTLSPIQNVVGLDGKPVADAPDPGPGGPPLPPGSRISEVRVAMEDIGQLAKFDQQVETLKFSLKVPASLESFSVAYNSVNSTLEVVLEEFASPQWDPWRLPFVAAMDAAKDNQDRDALVAAVDEARALLSESD